MRSYKFYAAEVILRILYQCSLTRSLSTVEVCDSVHLYAIGDGIQPGWQIELHLRLHEGLVSSRSLIWPRLFQICLA